MVRKDLGDPLSLQTRLEQVFENQSMFREREHRHDRFTLIRHFESLMTRTQQGLRDHWYDESNVLVRFLKIHQDRTLPVKCHIKIRKKPSKLVNRRMVLME